MKRQNLYLLLLMVFPVMLHSQSSWTRITPTPQENTINCITKIPGTNKLIAVGEGSTVMISENGGETWSIYLNPAGKNNQYNCNGVYFINESTGFIYGGKETILKTTDGGINWYLVYSGSTIYNWQCINEIEFINETTGFAIADNGQLFKSYDAGESWELIESGVDFDLNVLEFSDAAVGFIFAEGDEYLKTTDGGESWSVENLQPSIIGFYFKDVYFTTSSSALAIGTKFIQGITHGQIYKTDDAGNTWTEVYCDENGWYWPEAIDFIDESNGMVSFNTIMYGCINYVTNDGGETWEETPMFYFSWAPCRTLCYYDEDKVIIAGNMGMMVYSENGGGYWEFHSERTFFGEIFEVQFINQEIAFASAINGGGGVVIYSLFKTTDSGENWSVVSFIIASFNFHFINQYLGFIAFNDYITLNVLKTTDGGANWSLIESGNFDFNPTCIRFYNELNGLICGETTILKTSDGGNNWIEVNTDSFMNSHIDIEYKNADEVFICGRENGSTSILKSSDGGNTWGSYSFGSNLHATDIYFRDTGTAFLAGYDTILISEDGGETWVGTNINSQNNILFSSINFPTSNIGYAVGHGQYETIVKTTDGGETWNVINSKSTSNLNAVHFFDKNTGLVFGENGIVMKTTTGGITGFEEINKIAEKNNLHAYPNPFINKVILEFNLPKNEKSGHIFIYDQTCKQILSYPVNHTIKSIEIYGDKLKPGIYFYQLKTANGISETKKMIKIE